MSSTLNALLIPALVASLAGGGLRGTIVCIGQDGHVAIEPAGSKCCPEANRAEDPLAPAPATFQAGDEESGCGDCIDVALGVGAENVIPSSAYDPGCAPALSGYVPASATSVGPCIGLDCRSFFYDGQNRRMRASTIFLT